jgi:hypothetical protein
MLCVGCPIVIFHTVADACDAHDVDRNRFEDELSVAVAMMKMPRRSPVLRTRGS